MNQLELDIITFGLFIGYTYSGILFLLGSFPFGN